jgi:hypothetical protein
MNKTFLIVPILLLGLACGACNVGNAPSGPSASEIEATKKKLPIDEQIALIKSSPAPQAKKDEMIAKVKADAGQK